MNLHRSWNFWLLNQSSDELWNLPWASNMIVNNWNWFSSCTCCFFLLLKARTISLWKQSEKRKRIWKIQIAFWAIWPRSMKIMLRVSGRQPKCYVKPDLILALCVKQFWLFAQSGSCSTVLNKNLFGSSRKEKFLNAKCSERISWKELFFYQFHKIHSKPSRKNSFQLFLQLCALSRRDPRPHRTGKMQCYPKKYRFMHLSLVFSAREQWFFSWLLIAFVHVSLYVWKSNWSWNHLLFISPESKLKKRTRAAFFFL